MSGSSETVSARSFLAASVRLQRELAKRGGDGSGLKAPPDVVSHLTGIFLKVDVDEDGMINRPQLVQALSYVGITARDALVKEFMDEAARNGPSKRASVTPGPATRRLSQVAPSKIDLLTFVTVTCKELEKVKQAAKELDPLLFFMTADNKDTSQISVSQLRHLLVETLAPTRLSEAEFRVLLEALGLSATSSRSAQDTTFISTEKLKKKLILSV